MRQEKLGMVVGAIGPLLAALALISAYCLLAFLSHGSHGWWYIDFVSGGNVYWGDDAYRYFLARSAWQNADVYWFNFMLPVAAFLDGIVTTLGGDSIFYARVVKSFPLVASIFLTYHAANRLGAERLWAWVAAALLACLPLYVLVGLSFYGEAWFSFLVALSLYVLALKHWRLAALVIGLMPLVRIEGIAFIAGFLVYAFARRDLRSAFISLAPGAVYGFLVMVFGPGIEVFLGWRFDLIKVYEAVGIWYGGEISQFFKILFWPWLLCSVVALCQVRARLILPCAIGAGIVCLFQATSIVFNINRFEPRFLVPLCPVFAVGFSLFMKSQVDSWGKARFRAIFSVFASILVGAILLAQLFSVHVFNELKAYVLINLTLPDTVREHPLQLATYFKRADLEKVDGYREYANVTMRMIAMNPSIETLVVSNPHVFYFLDPARIPKSTNVVFAVFGRKTLDPVLGRNVSAGYFSHPPFFGYFSLAYPRTESNLLLYLDEMDLPKYPLHWNVRGNDIFLFKGGQTSRPN